MINKEIIIFNSHKVILKVLGKTDLPEVNFTDKEKLNLFYKEFVSDKFKKKSFILDQVHGDKFYNTTELGEKILVGDAIYSNNFDEILIVKTADCMPIFFWSIKEKLIGVIHSGWKGTALGITEKLFLELNKKYSVESIQSYLGPCIRQNQYEVGEDLKIQFPNETHQAFQEISNSKYLLDLKKILEQNLNKHQIPIKLEDDEICTKLSSEFYSHRNKEIGRNLNLIYMQKI